MGCGGTKADAAATKTPLRAGQWACQRCRHINTARPGCEEWATCAKCGDDRPTARGPPKTLLTLQTGVSSVPKKDKGRVYIVNGGAPQDQWPMLIVAQKLKQLGYDIRLCSGQDGKAWVVSDGFLSVEEFEKSMQSAKTRSGSASLCASEGVDAETLYNCTKEDPEASILLVSSTSFSLSKEAAVSGASVYLSVVNPVVSAGKWKTPLQILVDGWAEA